MGKNRQVFLIDYMVFFCLVKMQYDQWVFNFLKVDNTVSHEM